MLCVGVEEDNPADHVPTSDRKTHRYIGIALKNECGWLDDFV